MAQRTCSVDQCDGIVKSLGMCNKHYLRMRITGRTDLLPWQERFWRHVNKNGPIPAARPGLGPCWLWTAGTIGGGYGRFACETPLPSKMAHRVSYTLLVGPIPDGLQLDHLCRNVICVNPAHLEPVTGHVNILRGTSPSAQNARKDECMHGHPFTPENTYVPPKRPGRRHCRTCNNIRSAQAAQRRAALTRGDESDR